MVEPSLQDPSPTSSTPKDEIEQVANGIPNTTATATTPNDISNNKRSSDSNSILHDLQSRITKLEQVRFACPTIDEEDNSDDIVVIVDNAMRRARQAVEMAGCCYSAQWIWVKSNYYQRSLQERALFLQVPTTAVLCKSLLMENKKWISSQEHGGGGGGGGDNDAFNPKFVLVVLQYEATLDVTKLHVALQRYRQQHETKSHSKLNQHNQQQQYDWRIASKEDNDAVTGYSFNSVTPFGMLSPHVKIILASAIVHQQDCKYFVMGGGHVHLKLKMATSEFIEATNALLADVTNPRAGVVNDDEY
ncbi:hypothetical protein MHU86_14774 [Fragilaria crotonensis]|nr:hypothetical protein MHU86_14774 [Fragilaria crotonensis]